MISTGKCRGKACHSGRRPARDPKPLWKGPKPQSHPCAAVRHSAR
ncbi:CxxxxCH/CxxCH domain-containing protein [Agrobacterium rhizogenes]|nr:CxxxxCH/CxxCH domain-containing protein [Rhizobium rhizogenes]